MKMVKEIRKQAMTAERVATDAADLFVADQMKSLALAFRAQADLLKKKKKKKKR
jgi:Flp pilus assembly protein CpaB